MPGGAPWMLNQVQHDGSLFRKGAAKPEAQKSRGSEDRQRPLGQDQRERAAGDHRHPQPVGGHGANRLDGKGKRMGHVAGLRPKFLPKR